LAVVEKDPLVGQHLSLKALLPSQTASFDGCPLSPIALVLFKRRIDG
jgi:hypothetical protein